MAKNKSKAQATPGVFTSVPTPADQNPLHGLSIELDGVTFGCFGRMSLLESSALASAAAAGVDTKSPEGAAAVADFLRMAFGDGTYQIFRGHCRQYLTPDETLVEVIQYIQTQLEQRLAEDTGRPTRRPGGSASGQTGRGGHATRLMSLSGGDISVVEEAGVQDQDQEFALAQAAAEQEQTAAGPAKTPGKGSKAARQKANAKDRAATIRAAAAHVDERDGTGADEEPLVPDAVVPPAVPRRVRAQQMATG